MKGLARVALLLPACAGPPAPDVVPTPLETRSEPAPASHGANAPTHDQPGKAPNSLPHPAPAGLLCLCRLYGGRATYDPERGWLLAFEGTPEIPYDDGQKKSEDAWLNDPDLEDTLRPYTRGKSPSLPQNRDDAGRARHLLLLQRVYGRSEAAVREHLVMVQFVGQRVLVHERVAPALARVATRLEEELERDTSLAPYFETLGGGFVWRRIAGTDRLSAHAFGIALDLNPKRAAYYRWNPSWDGEFPLPIVEAFEAEGFIWGGAWEHFDSMHFEFRPELLDPTCTD